MEYLYVKSFHIIFIVTWFAGLFYIVRLFVYHTEALEKPQPESAILSNQFSLMSKRLWLGITWPSAILTLILGTTLIILQPEWLSMPFMHIKLSFVLLLYVYHYLCHRIYKNLQKGVRSYSSQQLRVWNEIATFLLVAIVLLIVVKNQMSWLWGSIGLIIFAVLLMLAIRIYKNVRGKS
ncbi:MAG: CopD family protein [Bacteroidota bacterium]